MNLEKLLAENLLRFGVKNLDNPIGYHAKFLMEQDPRAALNQIENDAAAYAEYQKFQKDAKSQYKNVTLIKTQKLVPINKAPLRVTDYFYNNFVTLELGVKDPKAIKAKLDDIITQLETAGANMTDPKTVIEIVSTATPNPAGTGPATRDFPNGVPADHKKLDHTYGGQLVYDKTGAVTAESKAWAKTNGNNFLAQQRGESAKKYLESKGVKASIIVIPITNDNIKTREFQITANQTGTEKVINPIGVPDIDWSYSVRVDVMMASSNPNGSLKDTYESELAMANERRADPEKFWKKYPYGYSAKAVWFYVGAGGLLGSMKYMIPVDASNEADQARKFKPGRVLKAAVDTARKGGLNVVPQQFRGMFELSPSSLAAQSSTLASAGYGTAEAAGAVGPFLSSVGHFKSGQQIVNEFNNILSPLVAQLLKTNIADKIDAMLEAYNAAYAISPYYTEIEGPHQAAYQKLFDMSFSVNTKGNMQDLVTAAAAAGIPGVSTTKSTDPAYWQNAYFFDYTTKNAQGLPLYGKLNAQNAAAFFAGAKFQ